MIKSGSSGSSRIRRRNYIYTICVFLLVYCFSLQNLYYAECKTRNFYQDPTIQELTGVYFLLSQVQNAIWVFNKYLDIRKQLLFIIYFDYDFTHSIWFGRTKDYALELIHRFCMFETVVINFPQKHHLSVVHASFCIYKHTV